MSEPRARLRAGTWVVALLSLVLATVAVVVAWPRLARRAWISRHVDARVQARYLTIQEKLDAGGAWGSDAEACRMALACLDQRTEPRCEACVVELVRAPDRKISAVLVVVREDHPTLAGDRYKRAVFPLLKGDDPKGYYDLKDLDIYTELRENGIVRGQYDEHIDYEFLRYGGTGRSGSVVVGLFSTETMNAMHLAGAPAPSYLNASEMAPIGSAR